MGSLSNFNDNCRSIRDIKEKYKLNIFCETGCFLGNSLKYASNFYFEKMFSCDVDIEMINHCKRIIPKIELFHGNSIDFLKTALSSLSNDSILFYLDAHLPEHDKNNGEILIDSELNFPLEEEINVINFYRKEKNDVIICDDLRIYEDGPFEGGNWLKRKEFNLNLDFLDNYNYNVTKYYNQEGYILLARS